MHYAKRALGLACTLGLLLAAIVFGNNPVVQAETPTPTPTPTSTSGGDGTNGTGGGGHLGG